MDFVFSSLNFVFKSLILLLTQSFICVLFLSTEIIIMFP